MSEGRTPQQHAHWADRHLAEQLANLKLHDEIEFAVAWGCGLGDTSGKAGGGFWLLGLNPSSTKICAYQDAVVLTFYDDAHAGIEISMTHESFKGLIERWPDMERPVEAAAAAPESD
jgi:hypothetical protein